ncbi:MAG: ribonuclease HII, partial [Acidobacteriota bacterium]|nr:ribonuclease HII [Acidobacteriota bacterium]
RTRRARASGRRLFAFDRKLEARLVAGADEAGRGSLAGPLVAAAVLFDSATLSFAAERLHDALNDSKQHTAGAREALYPQVMRVATRVTVVSRSVRAIDTRGLHRSNLAALADALARATEGIDVGADCICLIDGFALPELERPQRAIVDGDATSAAIAAASIVAKVTRDRFMHDADARYPGWGFAENVGYSTPEHRAAIERHGVCALHRLSFRSVAYRQLELVSQSA